MGRRDGRNRRPKRPRPLEEEGRPRNPNVAERAHWGGVGPKSYQIGS